MINSTLGNAYVWHYTRSFLSPSDHKYWHMVNSVFDLPQTEHSKGLIFVQHQNTNTHSISQTPAEVLNVIIRNPEFWAAKIEAEMSILCEKTVC